MTPRAIRSEIHAVRLLLERACRVDTRYRDHIRSAAARLVDPIKPGPKPRKWGRP